MNNTGCLDLNHMPQIPEADFPELNSHVISAHCTGIVTESLCPTLCVFVCHFLLSLVHKNSDKWVWRSQLPSHGAQMNPTLHQPYESNSSTKLTDSKLNIPLEVQVNTVGVLYPKTGLLNQKVIQLVLGDIAMQLLWLDCYISQFL